MNSKSLVLLAGCCASVVCATVAAPAAAVEYFFDDFNDGEMTSDWTDLQREVRAINLTRYGVYGHAAMGQDTVDSLRARASKPLSNTTLADTVYFSFDIIHPGGHMGAGGLGWKVTRAFVVNDSGEGYGIYLGYSKSMQEGQFGIITTTDFGVTDSHSGPGSEITLPPGYITADDFSEHTVGFAWDRVNAYINMYLDGMWVSAFPLDSGQNDAFKDPTQVISAPRHLYCTGIPGDWAWADLMTTDDIWFGDVPNPHAPDPILARGDTDGDLKVDIVDLTALGANWSTISPGAKNWNQGDFNYDWIVDIADLTALAANYIPEPATLSLVVLGGLGLLRRKRGYGA